MQFTCKTCGKIHDSIPAYGEDHPAQYWDVPEEKLEQDVFLTTDSCVISDRFFFVRGCLEIPVLEADEHLEWGVWVSLSKDNFFLWQEHYDTPNRSHIGPFFGWLSTSIPGYSETLNMKTTVCLRDNGTRPQIVLEKTGHPLGLEQVNGISMDRVQEIIDTVEHSTT